MRLVGKFPRLGITKGSDVLEDLIKNCGLISYNTPFEDKAGKTSRQTVRGLALVGDTNSYIKFTTLANEAFTYIDNTTKLEVGGSFDVNGEFIIPTNGIAKLTYGIYDLNIPMRQSDGIIELLGSDGSKIEGEQFISPANPTVLSLQESQQDKLGVTFAKALGKNLFNGLWEFGIYSGTTGDKVSNSNFIRNITPILVAPDTEYTLSTDIGYLYLVYEYDKDMNFIGQISGAKGTFTTSINTKYINFRTSALGQNNMDALAQLELGSTPTTYEPWEGYYRDSALLFPYEDGTPILTNYAYVSDGQGGSRKNDVEFNGAIKKNFEVVGGGAWETGKQLQLDQPYDGIGEYDTNRILTDATHEPKLITFDDSGNVDNNQFYQSLDKQKSLFFKEPLTEPCYTKAMKFVDLVEGLEDSEGSPLFDSENDRLYALKEGVVIK